MRQSRERPEPSPTSGPTLSLVPLVTLSLASFPTPCLPGLPILLPAFLPWRWMGWAPQGLGPMSHRRGDFLAGYTTLKCFLSKSQDPPDFPRAFCLPRPHL